MRREHSWRTIAAATTLMPLDSSAPLANTLATRTSGVSRGRKNRVGSIAGVVLCALLLAVPMLVVSSSPVSAATIHHVSPDGDDAANGSAGAPMATITAAVRRANDGDTIVIHPGRYHESVQVYEQQLDLVAAPGAEPGDVVLDGASRISGFTRAGGAWWTPWTTSFDRATAPFVTADHPEAGWPEQFFIDGVALDEAVSLDELAPGFFFHDRDAQRVWLADDPTHRLVEGSDLAWGLYLNRAHGSTVSGLTVQRFATQSGDMAAVRAYADDLTLTDVVARDNARIGLSVIGDRVHLDAPVAIDNGHLGIHAHQSSDVRIEAATVVGNNRARFDAFHSAGGFKITESTGLVFDSSTVVGNHGPGIWTDLSVTDAVIASNVVTDNGRSGIEIELSSDVTVIDNAVERNGEAGIWVLESSQVEVWHNQVFDNVRDIWIEDGPRSDVFDVVVANNLLGGDDRPDGAPAILSVDDWTEDRAAADMNIVAGANRYWLVPGSSTVWVSRWANWPQPLAMSADVNEHRAATGQGADSDLIVSATNPFAEPGTPGWTMPDAIAAAVGSTPGPHAAGPLDAHDVPTTVGDRDDRDDRNDSSTEQPEVSDDSTVGGTDDSTSEPEPVLDPTSHPETVSLSERRDTTEVIPVDALRTADRIGNARRQSSSATMEHG